MRQPLLALVLSVAANCAFAAPPAAWNARTCFSCHANPAVSGGPADLQTWPTRPFLAGLDSANFVSRLQAQAANSALMSQLANDPTPAGASDRAQILQYLLDVRDVKVTASVALSTVTIGAASGSTGTITITNERSSAVTYAAPSISPPNGYSVTAESCVSRSVAAGGSCTLSVRFLPTSPPYDTANRSATLGLTLSGTNGDPNPGPRSVSLLGTAQTPLEITAGPLSFVATRPDTSAQQDVTVTNRLGSDLQLCLVGAGGSFAAPGDFNLVGRTFDTGQRCTTLTSPGTSINQPVTFSPQGDGPRFARLTAQRVDSTGSPLDPLRAIELQGNPGPFITLQSSGLTEGNVLFSGVRQDVDAGATAPTVVTLTNAGSTSLRFSALTIPLVAGAVSEDYSPASGCAAGSTLTVGAFCDLSVAFNPSDSGLRTTQLQISFADLADTPDSRNTAIVELRGQGTRGASLLVRDGGGTLVTSGSIVAFGRQNIAVTYTRRLSLTNIGSEEGLLVAVPTLEPGTAGFALVASSESGGCSNLSAGFTLPAQASCTLDIRFLPTAVTNYATNLTLPSTPDRNGAPRTAMLLALSGEGVDGRPNLAWQRNDGSALAVLEVPGITAVGSPTPPQVSLRLANLGPGAAALTLLNVIGADNASFVVEPGTTAGHCNFENPAPVLGEGSTCSVVITFRPQTAGAKTARLQIDTTGTTPAPLELWAQASGPAATVALTALPATLNLNEVRVGAQSAPATVTLTNAGSTLAVVTAIDASAGFAFELGSCGALPLLMEPRSSCTLTVRFAPGGTGATSGSLRVQVSGVAAPVEVALQGNGAAAADASGGGCSISAGRSPADPTLWTLVLLAAAVLVYRQRRRGPAAQGDPSCRNSR